MTYIPGESVQAIWGPKNMYQSQDVNWFKHIYILYPFYIGVYFSIYIYIYIQVYIHILILCDSPRTQTNAEPFLKQFTLQQLATERHGRRIAKDRSEKQWGSDPLPKFKWRNVGLGRHKLLKRKNHTWFNHNYQLSCNPADSPWIAVFLNHFDFLHLLDLLELTPGGKLKAGGVVVLIYLMDIRLTVFGFWFPYAILRAAVIPSHCMPSIQGAVVISIVGFLGSCTLMGMAMGSNRYERKVKMQHADWTNGWCLSIHCVHVTAY